MTIPIPQTFHSDAEVIAIGQGVMERTLPKAAWTHAAHFAAALWLIAERPELDAALHMPSLIRAYNEATGVANTDTTGYHETITQASLRAARAFLHEHQDLSLHAAANALLESPLGRPDWLMRYWSRERLFSVQARRDWCEPDIRPLPY
jgi:hypothetical protein